MIGDAAFDNAEVYCVCIRTTLFVVLAVGANFAPRHLQSEEQGDCPRLCYSRPAEKWTAALPLGNGRMGAMVYGGVPEETIALNEQTLYAGEPTPCGQPPIHEHLATVEGLLQAGRYAEADQVVRRRMTGRLHQSFMLLGHLRLKFDHDASFTEYCRSLDLANAVAQVSYRVATRTYRRELFLSAVDDLLVIRLSCDTPGAVSCTAAIDTAHHFAVASASDKQTLSVRAKAPLYAAKRDVATIRKLDDTAKYPELFDSRGRLRSDIVRATDRVFYASQPTGPGMSFETRIRALAEGGETIVTDGLLKVTNADAVTLLVAAKTSFSGFQKSPSREGRDPGADCARVLSAVTQPYQRLRQAHVADHRSLFDRVQIDLGLSSDGDLPADRRLAAYARRADPSSEALMFQYGRYLLTASSRPGGWPANLQGLWSEDVVTPWCGAFHLDVNLAMNYWPAQVANLSECAEPLVDYIERLAANGQITAERSYRCRGWVAHIATSIWCNTDPLDSTPMAVWNMGGVWLCRLLWDHYAFSRDRTFLRMRAYPLLKGASQFCLDWLKQDAQGRLITPLSLSPENRFRTADGQTAAVSIASTMDMALIRELLRNTAHAAQVLDCDRSFCDALLSALKRLHPYQVGHLGQLQEWAQDWDRPGDEHRHLSHLWGVFPGTQIDPLRTPELAAAAARSLELRGEGDLEFSRAWRIGLWARLGCADRAHQNVSALLRHNTNLNFTTRCYPKQDQPFEIDGNLGLTAGIAAMLLQSRLCLDDAEEVAELHLLPALPDIWPNGSIRGLRAAGGLVVNLQWRDGRLGQATIHSRVDGTCRVRYAAPLQASSGGRSIMARANDVPWRLKRDETYTLTP